MTMEQVKPTHNRGSGGRAPLEILQLFIYNVHVYTYIVNVRTCTCVHTCMHSEIISAATTMARLIRVSFYIIIQVGSRATS